MKKIYVVMFKGDIWEPRFYTEENEVADRVEGLRTLLNSDSYWYKTLYKATA